MSGGDVAEGERNLFSECIFVPLLRFLTESSLKSSEIGVNYCPHLTLEKPRLRMVRHYAQGLTERQAEFIWPPYLLSSTVPGCLACLWNFCTLAFPEKTTLYLGWPLTACVHRWFSLVLNNCVAVAAPLLERGNRSVKAMTEG